MIPYWQFPALHLVGPLSLHVFGALVAIGILIGARVTMRRGEALGLPKEDLSNAIFWSVLIGFLFAHAFDLFAYQDGTFTEKLHRLINPFDGISSIGGFLGAFVTLVAYAVKKRQSLWAYCDSLAFGLAPGWAFGRLGCFSAHDHPGRLTSSFIGVKFPGGARHDLGFEEALFAIGLTLLFYLLSRRKRTMGLYVALFALFYGPVRFGLDFLRITTGEGADPRYFGFTPAQYASIAIFVAGIVLSIAVARRASREGSHGGDDAAPVAKPAAKGKGKTKDAADDDAAPSRA